MSGVLRVLVADDHAPTRAGVRMALEHGECEVCAEAANADDAVAAAIREQPDICLIDVHMPGSGIHAVSEIAARVRGTRVVMLTVSDSDDDLFDALSAGAVGYLLKDMDPAQLLPALRSVATGEAALPGSLTARLIDEFTHRRARTALTTPDGRTVYLTSKEWQVLELLDADMSTAEIARRLFLSPVTVRRHLSNILHKLGVTSREEARRLLRRRPPPASPS